MTARAFLEVLQEVAGGSSEPLTSAERDFLLSHAGLSEAELSAQGRASTQVELARDRVVLDASVLDGALTTKEVAELLGRAEANVRRSRLSGDLYAVNPGDPAGLRFPRWQFLPSGRVVPGLRRIIPAFPAPTHPLVIARFMTAPLEDLDDMSPVEWLGGGGAVDPVLAVVEDLGYV